MPIADSTRRLRLWLGGRATLFSLEVFFASTRWHPATNPPSLDLCGYLLLRRRSSALSNHAFSRRFRRPAESANLLKEGVQVRSVLRVVQGGRVRARDLACSASAPGSGVLRPHQISGAQRRCTSRTFARVCSLLNQPEANAGRCSWPPLALCGPCWCSPSSLSRQLVSCQPHHRVEQYSI